MDDAGARAILEVLDDVIVQYGTDGLVQWASASLKTVLGYDPKAVVGTRFRLPVTLAGGEMALPGRPTDMPDGWAAMLQTPGADGTLAWMDVAVRHLRDAQDRTVAAVVTLRDAAAREQNTAAWSLPEQAADIVARLDPGNRVVWVSPSIRWLTGWTQEQCLGETTLQRLHPADATTAAEQLLSVHSGQPEVTVEVRLRQHSGTYLWWQVTARRVKEGDQPSDVLLFYRNIDAQVRQRLEAQRLELLLRATLDAAVDPTALMRPVRDPSGELLDLAVVALNPPAAQFAGRTAARLVGCSAAALLGAPIAAAVVNAGGHVLDEGRGVTLAHHTDEIVQVRLWQADDLLGISWRESADHAAIEAQSAEVAYAASLDGCLEEVARDVSRLLGWTAEQLVGSRILDLAHPDDAEALRQSHKAVSQGRASMLTVRLRTGEGQWRPLTVTARPVTDQDGAPASLVGSWRTPDGAQRHTWRPALDASQDPSVVLTPIRDRAGCIVDFGYVDANPSACAFNHRTRDELLDATLLGLIPAHDAMGLLQTYIDVVETGQQLVADDFVLPHDPVEDAHHFDIRAVALGEQLLVTWRDVTDRRLTDERLGQSEQRYRLLAENASEVVLQTGADGRIEWASPSVRQVLGYRPESLLGRRVSELLEPGEAPEPRQVVTDSSASQRSDGQRRMRLITADGGWRWMSALGHELLDDAGNVIGGVDALRDVHDEVQAQESLEASESRLQMLLDTMAEGVVVRDAEGVITACNPAAQAILRLPTESIIGRGGPDAEWRGIHENGSTFPASEFPEAIALRTGRSVRGVVLGVPLADDSVTWLLIDVEVLREPRSGDVTGVVSTFTDITERLTAERKLREAQARYRLLAENASDFVLLADAAGLVSWASPSTHQLLGWRPDDLIGTSSGLLVHPDDQAKVDAWRRAAQEGRTSTDRVRVRDADGAYRWFLRSAHPVRDEAGSPGGQVAAYRDVQAEQQAEEQLAASERRYRLLAETMTDLVEEYDASWYLVWASPSAEALLGFTPEDLAGSFAPNLVHPDDDTATHRETVDARLAGGATEYRRRVRRLRSDGSFVWVDSTLSFRYDDAGSHVATYITSRDVDAQVRAETELARSQQRFSRMFTEHDAIMLLVDPATGVIVDANHSASRFYGYSRESLQSMNIVEINTAPREAIERQIQVAVEGRGNFFSFPHRLADGSVRTVEIHSSTIDDRDRILLFSIIRDVTDDLAARQDLAASDQRYRLLAENATDFVLFAGVDGTVKWLSPSAGRVLGWNPDDVIGRAVADYVHPADLPAIAEQQSVVAQSGASPQALRIRCADGSWRWFMTTSKPVRDHDGTLTGRVTGFQDVQAETRAREELRQAHERLELVLDSAGLGLWDWNMQTQQTVYNQRWAQIGGYALSELEPTTIGTWYQLLHPDDLVVSQERIAAHAAGLTDFYDADCRMRHRDGHWVWVRERGRIVERDGDGHPLRMTGTHEDITALKHATEALAASEQRFNAAMASAPVGMAVLDLDRTITGVNPALCALLGYSEQWLVGRSVAEILEESDDVIDRSARTRLRRTPDEAVTVEHRLVRSDQARVWVQQSVNLVHKAGGGVAGYVSQFADITEAREARHRLRDLAGRDPLTDLLNRRELSHRVASGILGRGQLLTLLFIDLDGLKQINDGYGHLVGDQVIRQFARRLRDVVGAEDLVARYGGDEFVVIFPGTAGIDDALLIAERVHAVARAPIEFEDVSITSTCSIGIAVSADGDFDAALAGADAATYRAKRAGRNCTEVFDPRLDG